MDSRDLKVMRRYRHLDRRCQFSGSWTRQHDSLLAISTGIDAETVDINTEMASALDLPEYKVVKNLKVEARGLAAQFSCALPLGSAPAGPIAFTVTQDRPDGAIVDTVH